MLSLTNVIKSVFGATKNEKRKSNELLGMVPEFEGLLEECVDAWFECIEAIRDTYEVSKRNLKRSTHCIEADGRSIEMIHQYAGLRYVFIR